MNIEEQLEWRLRRLKWGDPEALRILEALKEIAEQQSREMVDPDGEIFEKGERLFFPEEELKRFLRRKDDFGPSSDYPK
jgi:hypothetical protein